MAPPTLERSTHNHTHPTVSLTQSSISGIAISLPFSVRLTVTLPYQAQNFPYHRELQCACLHHQDKLWDSMCPLRQSPMHKHIIMSRHIALIAILFSSQLIVMRKKTWGNHNIRFPRSARDASRSRSAILWDPSVSTRSDWPDWANYLLPLSKPIGLFKLIVSFTLICLRNY